MKSDFTNVDQALMPGKPIVISIDKVLLEGELTLPQNAVGVVLFAHGSGSSRHSPRNQLVAKILREEGKVGTFLFDLMTEEEGTLDDATRELRFDIPFLAQRLYKATEWFQTQKLARGLKIGYFGSSTGAAAALVAAAEQGDKISAVVSRGGRPDLAGIALSKVTAPTLLIVGGADYGVIELNEEAFKVLPCKKKLEIVPGATHLFEEPNALEQVGKLAKGWFENCFS
jgi:pimeloyl-ACP methyl ester carboxylesterase